jgi:signal transduction histidine kinase
MDLRDAMRIAEQSNLAIPEYLAKMSHEIRTSLNGVLGLLDLIQGTELDEVQLNYLKKANLSAKSLLNIINDVWDISKIEASQLTVEAVIALTVTDKGIGIEALVLPDLFNSFTQADSSISRKFGGTGLGLTIVKALLTLMQGTINASSTVGVGSKSDIKLRLPLSQMEQQQRPEKPDIQLSDMRIEYR